MLAVRTPYAMLTLIQLAIQVWARVQLNSIYLRLQYKLRSG